MQTWGAAYARNEKDKVAALNYAAALRAAGQTGQAVAVMRKAAIYHPEDREVLAAFGKALAADGQFQEALATVRRAQRADNPDWQLLATEGGILDSLGKHDEARDALSAGAGAGAGRAADPEQSRPLLCADQRARRGGEGSAPGGGEPEGDAEGQARTSRWC